MVEYGTQSWGQPLHVAIHFIPLIGLCYMSQNGRRMQKDTGWDPSQLSLTQWWRHQMETFFALLTICAGNSLVTGEFPAKRPVTRSFEVFFDLYLNEQLSKLAGDLRRHRAHYDVTVMISITYLMDSHLNKTNANEISELYFKPFYGYRMITNIARNRNMFPFPFV